MRKKLKIIKTGLVMGLVGNIIFSTSFVKAATWNYSLGTSGFQKQEKSNWCWVASARNMAVAKFTSVNVSKTQEEVVKTIKGSATNVGGSIYDAMNAVTLFSRSGGSKALNSRLTLARIKEEINSRQAVLLGMQSALGGHAIILYGYNSDNKVRIYDPGDGVTITCKYADLRDGVTLSGYTYERTVYYC